MYRPKILQSAVYFTKRDAIMAFDKFKHLIKWRKDGQDSVVDIGCATGDLITTIILPHLTRNFTKIVGVDISEQMIQYARETIDHPKISFEQMDMSIDQRHNNSFTEKFDHLTSFCALHWIVGERQETLFKNLYSFLKPNGNCLLTIIGTNPAQRPYLIQMKNPKWAPYLTDANQHVSSYHFMPNPADRLKSLLEMSGFRNIQIEDIDEAWYPFRTDKLREVLVAINPFLTRIPEEHHDEYLDDLLNLVITLESTKRMPNYDFVFTYKLLYAFAEK